MPSRPVITRFAPSPTGNLHKGHAYSALAAYHFSRKQGGEFLLRIEDIDFNRCNASNTEQIFEDLEWLGIEWTKPVRIQSQHLNDYREAAAKLLEGEWLYPCFCTRKDILREIDQAGQAPHGTDGPIYPGTCRRLPLEERRSRIENGEPHALRLDLGKALAEIECDLFWTDSEKGLIPATPEVLGDAIIVRKDIATSYHLAVVLDDALQGVTDIIRGVDLFESTHLHRVLIELLELPVPRYHHHSLLTNEAGKRLAKRDQSITLKSLRESGVSAATLRKELGFPSSF
ncbi:MAG: tRNA glutamyl-Q(34) synthetase GluQRS [Verrucomicrobiota bacterium]